MTSGRGVDDAAVALVKNGNRKMGRVVESRIVLVLVEELRS